MSETDADRFLAGGGEMGALMRARDWSATPLGPVESWPQSLRSAVSILLPSKAQIVLFWGPELVTLYNDAYRPVYGAKHPSVLGLPAREAWSEIWDDVLRELFEGVLRTGEAFWGRDLPFFLQRHGFPEETFFDVSYDPVRDESGAVGGIFCIVSETTGRVVGERRMALLRDLAGRNATARTPHEACVLAMEAIAARREDLPFALAYLGDALQACTPGAAQALAAAPPNEVREVLLPGGKLVVGINPKRPFDAQYGDFLGLVAGQFATAIGNAQAYEAERQRAEQLAEIDRAKTAFFSNVSHEFRTPLTLMLGPIEDGLADASAPLPGAQRERFELARRSGLRLQKLVNTLLDFSRIEAGRAQASYEPVELGGLTADLASSFRSAVEKAGLRLEVDCAPLAEPAFVDRDMWEKIVLNLLSNAFKFTFEGSLRISLAQKDGRIELVVQDTGTGIPAAELPHVFERFRRVEGARSRTHEGTGIGLALVKELVQLHGGSIEVQSVAGQGCTFTVTLRSGSAHLPAERIQAARTLAPTALGAAPFAEEAERWIPDAAPWPEAAAPRGARVVWADDNADMREYVRRLLAPHYDVEAVADGEAALAAIRARTPDLVLADVMMPKLDGFGLLAALRAEGSTRDLPVLLLSARAGEEARVEGLNAGADDYIVKPFGARELLARVAARIELSRVRTRLRREQEDIDRLFAQLPVPTAVLRGAELVFETCNAAFIETVGGRDVVGKSFLEALPEARGQGYDELLLEVMRTGTPHIGRESLVRLARNGRLEDTYFTFIYAPLRSGPGQAQRVIAIVNEVTEQVRARKEIEVLADSLRDETRRKDEFLAILSHELRNPLAPIRNAVKVLREAPQDAAVRDRALPVLDRQVSHLIRLVDDLLDVTRISRGEIALQKEKVALAEIVCAAVETSRPLIEARGHQLHLDAAPGGAAVFGDGVRLAQVVANLLNNAASYTPEGGRIEVSARAEDGRGVIRVRDNGAGLPAGAMEGLFGMFVRGQGAKDHPDGFGVGLALAHRLVAMHGGTIEGQSRGAGLGSEFVVRLPLSQQPAAVPAPVPATASITPGKRILVVDDNLDAADSLGMVLRILGADVRVAHDGPAAIAAVEAENPAVVLLDIGMPGMSGYEVARRIRERDPQRRVALVALTGWGNEEDRRRTREAGFDHHLVKPANLDTLQALLGSLGGTA